ncbi:MAG TPA: hypothetical protein VH092_23570 [Urbifossiella sp.]|jgi:metal-responsive CopG/Arc/MetJ family transcriptional regulator|nr:hypothetical protein [Urbifossiella sp.]
MTRTTANVSFPEDIAIRLDAALQRRAADGRTTNRSAFITDAVIRQLDEEERADQVTRTGIDLAPGVEVIVPAGADSLRHQAYRLKITTVRIRDERTGHVHVDGVRLRLDGSPTQRRRSRIWAILDPARLLLPPAE